MATIGLWWVAPALPGADPGAAGTGGDATPVPQLQAGDFEHRSIEMHTGDAKMLADVTGDGRLDWIVGGRADGEPLDVLPFPYDPATRITVATADEEFTTDAEAADMNGDGLIDLVTPDGCSLGALKVNLNGGGGRRWTTSTVGTVEGHCLKDVEVADFDGDGRNDIAVRYDATAVFYQVEPGRYLPTVVATANEGAEGLDSGDIDGDGDVDLIGQGVWLENPGRPTGNWAVHRIGPADAAFRAVAADLNGDGRTDVAFSCAECGTGGNGNSGLDRVTVYLADPRHPAGDPAASWTPVDLGSLPFAHTLEAADLDGDGDLDLLGAQLSGYAGSERAVLAFVNGGDGTSWSPVPLAPSTGGIHIGRVGDIDGDGDIDLVGSNFTGSQVLEVYTNRTDRPGALPGGHVSPASTTAPTTTAPATTTATTAPATTTTAPTTGTAATTTTTTGPTVTTAPATTTTTAPPVCAARSLDTWTYVNVDDRRDDTRFRWGLGAGDLDGDGDGDLVAGNRAYLNPGGSMAGPWPAVGGLSDASLVLDIDGDAFADVIDLGGGVTWREWDGAGFTTVAGPVGPGGAQGYRSAQFVPGGPPEIVYSATTGASSDTNSVQLVRFGLPASPGEAATITVTTVTDHSADEGIGVGDLDGDGDPDLTIGDGTHIAWFENPATATADPGAAAGPWREHVVGRIDHGDGNGGFTDRTAVADIDGDGRADIVATEETFGGLPADTYWFRNPGRDADGPWTRSTIATQDSTNSLGVADLDGDGDPDVVTGEHAGALAVTVWENADHGRRWVAHTVSVGRETHLGMLAADLDGDGDLDLASIAFDTPSDLHLWRNDAPPACTPPVAAGPDGR